MALKVERTDVWAAGIEDKPGGLNAKLADLADAGANFEFVFARRTTDRPGEGVVFVTPLKGAKILRAAANLGFNKVERIHSLRVEASDKPGLGAQITRRIADSRISVRGFSGAKLGNKAIFYLAFDNAEDAVAAMKALKKA
ncbi:MAG TPA: amino acid-binding protein [Planctomycetota bacterium]|jgi:hypothetical protein